MTTTQIEERKRRWRLILGGGEANGIAYALESTDARIDEALGMLYDPKENEPRKGGLGKSAPRVARWLGDIREYFPSSVVRILQKDAMEKLNLRELMLEPEMLSSLDPDVHLAADIIALGKVIPDKSKEIARQIVRKIVDQLLDRLRMPMQQAIKGSLTRAVRNRRPRHKEIDWNRTIRANLKNYQPDYKSIIPEQLIGFGRQNRQKLRDIFLCVDQSGSMATSVVYASIFAAVMASIPAVKTQLVVFDTQIVDLTEMLSDPVEVLFGTQLGGGTDINRALAYCQTKIEQPQETILILITDLYEGGNSQELIKRAASIIQSGVQLITLLALSDNGAPGYDHAHAQKFSSLGSPTFACTPDLFPELMAIALQHQDIEMWAAKNNIVLSRG